MTTRANGEASTTPISSFQFTVHSVDALGNGVIYLPQGEIGFTDVSGLTEETEAYAYKEGNDGYERMLPGRTKSGEITLSRGLDRNSYLLRWREGIRERTALPTGNARNDVIITVYDRRGAPGAFEQAGDIIRILRFKNAWPRSLEMGDLSGTASDINVTRCVLVFDGPYETIFPLTA